MIKEKCFTEEWLDSFKKQAEHRRIDKIILEKMIYAFHLLEQLKVNGLKFVFKGGTSLVLLLEEGNRFSIDIDIICRADRMKLDGILEKVVKSSKFKSFRLDAQRSYKPGVPKAHYIFEFKSVTNVKYSGKLLLDVLIEDSIYPELVEKPIQTKWLETETPIMVTVPSVDSITGDKLTAFAPNTIGIPYFKSDQSFAMEICKQLFDLGKLFDRIENVEIVARSFQLFAEQEIAYRKDSDSSLDLSPGKVLQDTLNTCVILTIRGNRKEVQVKDNFRLLQDGVRALGTGFLMTGNFRIDDAVAAAARVAHLTAKLMVGDFSPIQLYQGQDIKALNIQNQDWNYLNRLKRQPDNSIFYYWYHTVELLTKVKK